MSKSLADAAGREMARCADAAGQDIVQRHVDGAGGRLGRRRQLVAVMEGQMR